MEITMGNWLSQAFNASNYSKVRLSNEFKTEREKIKTCLNVTGKWNLLPAYREHLKHILRRAEAVMSENILWDRDRTKKAEQYSKHFVQI